MITVLAGGTGSVKLVRGLYKEFKNITVISNVADNFWFQGLYICPDIDTIIYGLSNNLDINRGWGLKDETFNFLNHLKDLKEESWFGLGDKDLVTHILRTKMIKEGKNLSEITDYFTKKYNLSIRIIPASNNHYETRIITNNKVIHLQEFWIKYRGKVPVKDITYQNIEKATIHKDIKNVLETSKLIILAPGNPITSIGSIISLKAIGSLLQTLKRKAVMVSPFISNKAISGPSEKYMKAKQIDPSIEGLVKFYSPFTNTMIFSKKDKLEIERKFTKNFTNINFYFTNILMDTRIKECKLARYILSNFYYT